MSEPKYDLKTQNCKHCGKLFLPNHPNRKYCYVCSPQGVTHPPYWRLKRKEKNKLVVPDWLPRKNLENALFHFRDELIKIKNGEKPELTHGERDSLRKKGLVTYTGFSSTTRLILTDFAKTQMEALQ